MVFARRSAFRAPTRAESWRRVSGAADDDSKSLKVSAPAISPTQEAFADVPGVKTEGDKMVLVFTCKVCETRSAKKISRRGYETGVVVVRCGGCQSLHLIADRVGIFEEPGWSIETAIQQKLKMRPDLKANSEGDDVLELISSEHIVGESKG